MTEHKWKFGDWGREIPSSLIVRFITKDPISKNSVWVFPDGSIGYNRQCNYLPDCTGFDWKPKPNYRPFANAEEFKPQRDRWWRYKGEKSVNRQIRPPMFYSEVSHGGRTWQDKFRECEFEDGSPFGVENK